VGGHCDVALDGPWDVHRILGTVPVEPDGSAAFRVPANTPIAVQPLDAEGKALQVMRSWFTAMPGERLSCVGCHEKQHHAPPGKPTVAMRKAIRDIEPFYGPARGFSFAREVQPVLDAHCVGCHNGRKAPQGRSMPDFSVERDAKGNVKVVAAFRKHRFTPSYLALHRYVRRPTPESDYHLSEPLEFHADTSRLVQLLRKGHKGVRLDAEGWDRLITWIDLNVPDHGTWREVGGVRDSQIKRRNELNARYAGLTSDPEAVPETPTYKPTLGLPRAQAGLPRRDLSVRGWPMDAETARQRQAALGETTMRIDLGLDAEGKPITLTMVRVPAGRFVMGDAKGPRDEWPRVATVDEPFWIGRMEVTNAQFARFDPDHDSRYFNRGGKDQSDRGIPLNQRAQPVVRVSWEQAKAFGSWLSARTGKRFDLPSETQWEYAARAGSDSDAFYGSFQDDFSRFANLADRRMANHSGKHGPKWRLADDRFDDRALVTEGPGNRPANAFGLVHAIGNAAEWTRTLDERAFEGGLDETGARRRVVKGGSFYDRPFYARSASRRSYREYQKVFDVGFRVVCTDGEIARKSPEGS
jgi:formylglycine-generating enzyme required for sulfatase activity